MSDTYADLAYANNYFETERLNADAWLNATNADQLKALLMATRFIDRFNFWGTKFDPDQTLEFPRDEEEDANNIIQSEEDEEEEETATVPDVIKRANAEIALHLLDGWNPDLENANLGMAAQGLSSAKVTYDPATTPPYRVMGLPSQTVWDLLRPYIRDVGTLEIRRV
jgi:hypothetical protein